jgi:hypothetical protein
LCPTVHKHDVDCNSMHPGGELRLATEVLDASMHLHEDLLNQVLKLAVGNAHSQDKAGYKQTIVREQIAKGALVACLKRCDRRLFGADVRFRLTRRNRLIRRGRGHRAHFALHEQTIPAKRSLVQPGDAGFNSGCGKQLRGQWCRAVWVLVTRNKHVLLGHKWRLGSNWGSHLPTDARRPQAIQVTRARSQA